MEFPNNKTFIQNGILHWRSRLFVNFIPYVSEKVVFDIFASIGHIIKFRLPCGSGTDQHRGYAFVTYKRAKDAARAVDVLDGLKVGSKIIHVEYARVNFEEMRNAKLFVGNLQSSITTSMLRQMCQPYGSVISCRIIYTRNHDFSPPVSRGFGFVLFHLHAEAANAVAHLNGAVPCYFDGDGRQHQVGHKPMVVRFVTFRRFYNQFAGKVGNDFNMNYFAPYPYCYTD